MNGFLLRILINAAALGVASELLSGIHIAGFGWLVLAAFLFGIVNAVVRPVAVLLSLPLTIVTLGLFLLVVNAAMLGLTALLVPGMRVDGFWSAVFGSIVISVVSWAATRFVGDGGGAVGTR